MKIQMIENNMIPLTFFGNIITIPKNSACVYSNVEGQVFASTTPMEYYKGVDGSEGFDGEGDLTYICQIDVNGIDIKETYIDLSSGK